jgi:hypothetical protein
MFINYSIMTNKISFSPYHNLLNDIQYDYIINYTSVCILIKLTLLLISVMFMAFIIDLHILHGLASILFDYTKLSSFSIWGIVLNIYETVWFQLLL